MKTFYGHPIKVNNELTLHVVIDNFNTSFDHSNQKTMIEIFTEIYDKYNVNIDDSKENVDCKKGKEYAGKILNLTNGLEIQSTIEGVDCNNRNEANEILDEIDKICQKHSISRLINKELPWVGYVMSNFDREINKEKETELKKGGNWGSYSGENFVAYFWFNNNKFECEIWRYHTLTDIIIMDTLEEIMETVSNKYGWD